MTQFREGLPTESFVFDPVVAQGLADFMFNEAAEPVTSVIEVDLVDDIPIVPTGVDVFDVLDFEPRLRIPKEDTQPNQVKAEQQQVPNYQVISAEYYASATSDFDLRDADTSYRQIRRHKMFGDFFAQAVGLKRFEQPFALEAELVRRQADLEQRLQSAKDNGDITQAHVNVLPGEKVRVVISRVLNKLSTEVHPA